HLDDDEIALVRDRGAQVAHNARSNMNNGIGRARVEALGPRVALGTDGIGSDMFEEPALGTLEVGAPADLVVLDYDSPAPLDDASLAGHWIFGLASRWVRDVMVAGEWVVLDRRLARLDQQELVDRARREAERLWRRLDGIEPHSFEPKGGRPWPSPLVTA
ncbi:MAG TPA: hypothetical protein VLA98_01210, partial [Solirubrobacteraceae bacterium]|nr:hypothetical protein [Solirubrobacteraceae bacterium]